MTGGKFNQDYGIGEIKVVWGTQNPSLAKIEKVSSQRPPNSGLMECSLSEPLALISAFNLCSYITPNLLQNPPMVINLSQVII